MADQPQEAITTPGFASRSLAQKLTVLARRFLVPSFVVSAYAFLRWQVAISTRAEVELSPFLRLGRRTTVGSFTKIKASWGPITVGEECGFATGCFISAGAAGLEIGNHVICGPNVTMSSSNYRYDKLGVPLEKQGRTSLGIRIGNNVWIGANSVITDGSVIGDNCIVVANSLVNRHFPANAIIQGNPAKVILQRHPTQS